MNAEWATKCVIDAYVAIYKEMDDENIRDRYIDIEDVGERLQIALGGSAEPYSKLKRNSAVVSAEVRPSTLVELAESHPVGIVTESGGGRRTLSSSPRELGLPAVTGVEKLFKHIRDDDTLIIDGYVGEVIVNPTKDTLKAVQGSFYGTCGRLAAAGPTQTLDGTNITIAANADTPAVYGRAKALGASGVGCSARSTFSADRKAIRPRYYRSRHIAPSPTRPAIRV